MGRNNKRRKEEYAEDWCFSCKDGGELRVCDYRMCLKAYHPHCVGKDDSFLETNDRWFCGWHSCLFCRKASKFQCFCCPRAVCGRCISGADFAIMKGNKGFCSHCLKLALLREENADVDSDGDEIDFKDRDTYECLFSEYLDIIKEKEGLTSLQLYSAHNLLKKGKICKCDSDLNKLDEDYTGEAEDESNCSDSDYDDLNDTEAVKLVQKKKKCMRKLKLIKGKVKDKKNEYIGWGSKILLEFLHYTGRDTSKEFSQHDVASIIMEYCKEKKLFHPEKKRKILCDVQLRSLLGRKSVVRNSIYHLITPHFAENIDEMEDDIMYNLENRDEEESFKCRSQRKLNSSTKFPEDLVSEDCQSCLAAIVTSNLKLVYLKRSLVEELMKQPESFDSKLMGSFVRIKSDPNDYLQKNLYQLVQVIGVKRSSKIDEMINEILLQLSNVPKEIPICKISDDNFSEEECQDLCQRMKNGLLKQPTVLELEQKARSLHEDMLKHWIPRELALLQNRIDQANEKGWRRELFEYMEQKLLLETPTEQSRLLHENPKVIPEVVNMKMSLEDSPSKDKWEQNDLPDILENCNSLGNQSKGSQAQYLKNGTDAAGLKTPVERDQDVTQIPASFVQSTSKGRHGDSKAVLSEELRSKPLSCNLADRGVSQTLTRETESGSVRHDRKWNPTMNAEQTSKVKQSIPIADLIELSDNDEPDANKPVEQDVRIQKKQSISVVADLTELSDNEEGNPEIYTWHCVGPYGERRGPLPMSLLKRWSESSSYALKFKVWKTGQSETEAILLTDALRQAFPNM